MIFKYGDYASKMWFGFAIKHWSQKISITFAKPIFQI